MSWICVFNVQWLILLFSYSAAQVIIPENRKYCDVRSIDINKLKCSDLKQNVYSHGEEINCTCVKNCRPITLFCDPSSSEWQHEDGRLEICQDNSFTVNFQNGILKANYFYGTYELNCEKGYELVGEPKVLCPSNAYDFYNKNHSFCKVVAEPTNTTSTLIIPATPKSKYCSNIITDTWICQDLASSYVPPGTKRNCTCKSNCRNFTQECLNDGSWLVPLSQQYCDASPVYIDEGHYIVLYTQNSLVVKCKNSTINVDIPCINGELQRNKPNCMINSRKAINSVEDQKNTITTDNADFLLPLFIVIGTVFIFTVIVLLIFKFRYKLRKCFSYPENEYAVPEDVFPFCVSESIPRRPYVTPSALPLSAESTLNVVAGSSTSDPAYLAVLPPHKYDYVVYKDLRKKKDKRLIRKKRDCSQCKAERDVTQAAANETAGYLTPRPLKYDYIDCKDFRKDSREPDVPAKAEVTTRGQERSQVGAQCYENVVGPRAERENEEEALYDDSHYEVVDLPLPSKKNKKK